MWARGNFIYAAASAICWTCMFWLAAPPNSKPRP
jgi:hypothetical protein